MRTNWPCGYFVFPLTWSAWQLFLWRTSFSISCWGTLVNSKRCIYSNEHPGTGVDHQWLTVVASLCPNISLICFKNFFFFQVSNSRQAVISGVWNLLMCCLLSLFSIWHLIHLNSSYCNKSVLCCSKLSSPVLEHLTALNLKIALFMFFPVCICRAFLFYGAILFILIKIGSLEWRGFGEARKTAKRFCCCYCLFALVDLNF